MSCHPCARQPKPTTPSPYLTKIPTTPSQKTHATSNPYAPNQQPPATAPNHANKPPTIQATKHTKEKHQKTQQPLLHKRVPINPKSSNHRRRHYQPQQGLSQNRHNNLQNNRRQKIQDHHTNPTPKTTTHRRNLTCARYHCIQAAQGSNYEPPPRASNQT